MKNRIVFCMIARNDEVEKVKKLVEQVRDYVDYVCVITDFFCENGVFEYLTKEYTNQKIGCFQYEWKDHFSDFRNHYLEHCKEGDYILLCDSDEWFPTQSLEMIRGLVEESEDGKNYNTIKFKCNNIYYHPNNVVHNYMADHFRGYLFKWYPKLKYIGTPHETLIGMFWRERYVEGLVYEHRKQWSDNYYHGVRNYFISNSNAKTVKWKEFRKITDKYDINDYHRFFELLYNGKIPDEIIEYSIKHRNDNDIPQDSEIRALFWVLKEHYQNKISKEYIDDFIGV